MNLLLDTHTFIWLLEGDQNLSSDALSAIQNDNNTCFLSNASFGKQPLKSV
ncbi:hypothetical protein K8352_00710 [Flavobacteriaceae bacterium F89]|uniref:PIN domain-containing protein n=1 Tax=Cerina litoralis TaxID=2874477 RepID=A0AAE3ETF8_9FLAO|nr:hypothetical protein [Cerina litoralis]MCG2459261.1 hypothetical protein [Cerina litoralis]